ncbi:MAG: glutamate racemase [Lachnospiraceae bacterium]|nr:glutamate racemase [Lachnospiraceae bacterium]
MDNPGERYAFVKEHPKEFDLIHSPIAVFDSGVGGISVLRELVKIMPNENFLYFGDSANAPYGTKSTEEVRELTISKVEDFMSVPVKGCVIACNSATSAAVRKLREMYPHLPLVGIEPALKPAALHKRNPRVLVLATPMTIKEDKFRFLFERFENVATIYKLPCPGLMEYVETGKVDSKEVRNFIEELLMPYRDGTIDTVVLGCTHYPFVQDIIAQILGPGVAIFDGGEGTAREMKRRIEEAGLLTDETKEGEIVFENSLNSPKKIELCHNLLNMSK